MPEIGSSKFNAGTVDSSKTGASSNFTAVEGTTYSIDMSTGTPSANLVITLPTPSQGNSCAFVLKGEDLVYGVEFIGKIATVDYSSGNAYKLLQTGDHVVFRYVDENIGWLSDTLEKQPAFELETLGTLEGAWSLQQAVTGYSGNIVRVRRSSDNAEQDIGLSDTTLDVAALETFCAATDGFVVTWYDQSGNEAHWTTRISVLQPKIVAAGTYLTYLDGDSQSGIGFSFITSSPILVSNSVTPGSFITGTDEHTFILSAKWDIPDYDYVFEDSWHISTLAQYNANLSAANQAKAIDMVLTYDANADINNWSRSMEARFQGRDDIVSIPDGLFDSTPIDASFMDCFGFCPNLTSIPAGLFDNNTASTNFTSVFYNCASLTSIPAGLFDNNTLVGELGFTASFESCASLTSIPAGLFDNNTLVTSFQNIFRYCTSLTSIPAGLFDNNTAVTKFSLAFQGCTSLTSIPAGLFDNNTLVNNFSDTFSGCTSLTSIPAGLFDNNTLVTGNLDGFYGVFARCTSLTTIPAGLFDNNTVVTSFRSTFDNCTSLTSIPTGLFDNNTLVTSFQDVFKDCTSLTTIPAGLFDNNTAVAGFNSSFQGCTSLASIPAGLFDNNTLATFFASTFLNCTSLTAIPAGLFDSNVALTGFSNAFGDCTSLTSIPAGLFDNNTLVTSFFSVFGGCTSLTSIPDGLFDNNTAATSFQNTFDNCTSLTSIPTGLFDNNTAVTLSRSTFENCTSLTTVPANIYDNIAQSCDYLGIFTNCALTQESVDNVLVSIDSQGITATGGDAVSIDGGTSQAPGTTGSAAKTNLEGRSWVVTTNPPSFALEGFDDLDGAWSLQQAVTGYSGNIVRVRRSSDNAEQDIGLSGTALDVAALETFCAATDGFVVTWYDQSGNAVNLSQAATADQPKIVSAGTYLTHMEFDTGDNFDMTITATGSLVTGSDEHTFITESTWSGVSNWKPYGNSTNLWRISTLAQYNANLSAGSQTRVVDMVVTYDANAVVDNFSDTMESKFRERSDIVTLPDGLFDSNTTDGVNLMFASCFQDCTSLTSIPASLFPNAILSGVFGTFGFTFLGCTSITSIPAGLFDNVVNAQNTFGGFQGTFDGCTSLINIPAGLFDTQTTVRQAAFQECFRGCTSLTAIPAGLFDNCTSLGGGDEFREAFKNCTSLVSIGAAAFRIPNATTRGFSDCFADCTSLPAIPADLFDNVNNVGNTGNQFRRCFQRCSSLASIPAGLFDIAGSTITVFTAVFDGCTSLTSIPAGLFDNVTAVLESNSAFNGCTSLTTVPANIYDNVAQSCDYDGAFTNCALTQASVDNILVSIDSQGITATGGDAISTDGGTSAAPGAAGATAKTNLQGRSWVVNTN